MYNNDVTPSTEIQLSLVYKGHTEVGTLTEFIPAVQRQTGSADCGLFAIAFIVEYAFNGLEDATNSNFKQSQMRTHLAECIANDRFQHFPKEGSANVNGGTTHKIIPITCICRMPGHYKKGLICTNCFNEYHLSCLNISVEPIQTWVCPSCIEDMTAADEVEENYAKRQKLSKEIDSEKFTAFLSRNKKNIVECMRTTTIPNRRDSLKNYQEIVELLSYEDAIAAMNAFINSDKDFRKLQGTSSLILNNARFERAFVIFLKKYLSSAEF